MGIVSATVLKCKLLNHGEWRNAIVLLLFHLESEQLLGIASPTLPCPHEASRKPERVDYQTPAAGFNKP